jgi:prophage DNA circulation protein
LKITRKQRLALASRAGLLDALELHAGGTLKGPTTGRMSRIVQGFAVDDLPLASFGAATVMDFTSARSRRRAIRFCTSATPSPVRRCPLG